VVVAVVVVDVVVDVALVPAVVAVSSCPACEMFLREPVVHPGASSASAVAFAAASGAAAAAAGHQTTVPGSSPASLACVLNSPAETLADVHGGAGAEAAVARTAASNLSAQAACDFETVAAADAEKVVAADASSAYRRASGGVSAAAQRGPN